MTSKYNIAKKRTGEIIEPALRGDGASKFFDVFIVVLILLNVLAVIFASLDKISHDYHKAFRLFEIISVIIFSIEYLLRIWSFTENKKYKTVFWGRIGFMVTPILIIDLLAILPFYLPLLIPIDLRFLRALRLIRLFSIFKFARYSNSLNLLGKVLRNKKEEMIITIFTVFILLIIASSLMYFLEHDAQPDMFSSIPSAMWWGIITLTTVGYGDVYPITLAGKITGAAIAVIGIGLFALPAGILGSGFIEEIQSRNRGQRNCPHCGKNIE